VTLDEAITQLQNEKAALEHEVSGLRDALRRANNLIHRFRNGPAPENFAQEVDPIIRACRAVLSASRGGALKHVCGALCGAHGFGAPDERWDELENFLAQRLAPVENGKGYWAESMQAIDKYARAQDQREVERLRAALVEAVKLFDEIEAQWSSDYLWTKWGLTKEVQSVRDALTRAEGE
jgi:hypothetical protein